MSKFESYPNLSKNIVEKFIEYGITNDMLNDDVIVDIVSGIEQDPSFDEILKQIDLNDPDPLRKLLFVKRKPEHEYQVQYDQRVLKGEDVSEGYVQCKRCGSRKVEKKFLQARAGDEEQNAQFICVNCGNKWKE